MKAIAWKLETANKKDCVYRIQVEELKGKRTLKKVYKILDTWQFSAEGYDARESGKILIFSKKFKNSAEWLKWAKEVPLNLIELNSKGRPKPVKLGLNIKKRKNLKKAAECILQKKQKKIAKKRRQT